MVFVVVLGCIVMVLGHTRAVFSRTIEPLVMKWLYGSVIVLNSGGILLWNGVLLNMIGKIFLALEQW